GMTGTAMTEESEFGEIYELDIIEIPTNRPVQRIDEPDLIFKNEKGKFNAVIDDIIECHEKGQPVLVGTISIEKSELLSSMLKRRGIKHNVLNAKQHEKEAEIVAQAGKKGAVTIATNMAGRGTDIILGGNAEFLALSEMRKQGFDEELISQATSYGETDDQEILNARETFKELNQKYKDELKDEADEVRKAGGLYIIGTERHESRRIDNQLRGRSGRQGDPGKSRFYLSTDDDLMRLFGGERMEAVMTRLNTPEDMPIENKMLSSIIESSQQKVEGRNFAIRKNVLQYDDVMNKQREIIYSQRDQVLNGENIKDVVVKMINENIEETVKLYCDDNILREQWNVGSLKDYYTGWVVDEDDDCLDFTLDELADMDNKKIIEILQNKASEVYEENEKLLPEETMREMERVYLLKSVDTYWMQHIDDMDNLKQGIRLRAYGQKDPVVEYRLEGFDMFDQMIDSIRENTAKLCLSAPKKIAEIQSRQIAEVERAKAIRAERIKALQQAKEKALSQGENADEIEKEIAEEEQESESPAVVIKREQMANPTSTSGGSSDEKHNTTVRNKNKVGRNDPCPCGSGKKYKKCCGKDE
ncbi:MAG: SEC-C metal-binding domain-containing protein, partial [Acutalibacteraceae bacterium]|nr:SEC-C metal-binding domain-containing protein [Acutalibacteraceae bacterium]